MAKMVNVGFGNVVAVDKIVAVMMPDSAQTKRTITKSREEGKFLDASHGRRTRSVIVTESGHVIVSGLLPSTIADRISKEDMATEKEPKEKSGKRDKRSADGNIGSKRNGQRYGLQEIT